MTDDAAKGRVGVTRQGLLDGSLHRMIARGAPDIVLFTEAERAASLAVILAARPDQAGGVWLFCYGSLIWNPTIDFDDRRVAIVQGWHRSFCLSARMGRGTPEAPGLLLGLDEGGTCAGIALHIPESMLEGELAVVWAREMVAGAYQPRWLALHARDGVVFGHGIAFTIDRDSPAYVKGLTRAETIRRLATASGELGSSAEYLLRTRDGLREVGVPDRDIEDLAAEVLAARDGGPAKVI